MTQTFSPRLSGDDLFNAQTLLAQLIARYFRSIPESERDIVESFLYNNARTNFSLVLRPDMNDQYVASIFSSEVVTTFLLELHRMFFLQASFSAPTALNYVDCLCQNVLDSLMIAGDDESLSLLPNEIKNHLAISVFKQIKSVWSKLLPKKAAKMELYLFLRNNTWLALMMLVATLQLEFSVPEKVDKEIVV